MERGGGKGEERVKTTKIGRVREDRVIREVSEEDEAFPTRSSAYHTYCTQDSSEAAQALSQSLSTFPTYHADETKRDPHDHGKPHYIVEPQRTVDRVKSEGRTEYTLHR